MSGVVVNRGASERVSAMPPRGRVEKCTFRSKLRGVAEQKKQKINRPHVSKKPMSELISGDPEVHAGRHVRRLVHGGPESKVDETFSFDGAGTGRH